jgi:AcrR family transcriptional regulator
MGTTVRRSHEERRGEIADAALRIIATRGIAALTVAALAGELGLTGGALYRHFSSTEEILVAVAARAVELVDGTVPDADLPPLEWLERFVESRAKTVGGHPGLARLLVSDQLAMALPAAALEHVQGAVRRTFAAIERAIRRGQELGDVRDDVEARDLVPIVAGTVQLLALARAGSHQSRVLAPTKAWATLRTLLAAPKEMGGLR